MCQPGTDIPARATGTPTKKPAIVFAHSGGFVFCDLDTHGKLYLSMANTVGAVVVSVDYRLAPEHPASAAAHHVHAALKWVRAHALDIEADPTRLVVTGDSAGGNLAAEIALIDRGRVWPALAGQVLICPVIDNDLKASSY
nr:alpha/beta hydrolase fold domain-containing protein [Rhodococcus qingshengii]